MKLTIFGGKGGVGKTSSASSAAVQLALQGKKTLLLSADPAHSLSDRLNQKIGNKICRVSGFNSLFAIEIDAQNTFVNLKEEYGNQIKELLNNSTYLDDSDIEGLYSLTIPGLDEVASLTKMLQFIEDNKFEYYILDTAPTGHALRLLELPNVLDQWIKMLAKLRLKYIYMVSRFSRHSQTEITDDFLFKLKKSIKKLYALLQDSRLCNFVVVTLAENIVFEETKRLIATLRKMNIPVKKILVNRVLPNNKLNCEICQKKIEEQQYYIKKFHQTYKNLKIHEMPELFNSNQSIEFLKQFPYPGVN